jgi:hypothetical protein
MSCGALPRKSLCRTIVAVLDFCKSTNFLRGSIWNFGSVIEVRGHLLHSVLKSLHLCKHTKSLDPPGHVCLDFLTKATLVGEVKIHVWDACKGVLSEHIGTVAGLPIRERTANTSSWGK